MEASLLTGARAERPNPAGALSGSVADAQKAGAALKQAAISLGLPPDKLSASLISFARYFSLTLEPSMLSRLRRDLHPSGRAGAALAAAAAEDKGVRLSPKALSEYEKAIDPVFRDADHEGSDRRRQDSGNQYSQNNDSPSKKEPPPGAVEEIASGINAEAGVLGFLNKIPGKNNKHWVVIPVNYEYEGRKLNVSVRFLITGDKTPAEPERLAIDAVGERRWLFVLDKPGQKDSRAIVQVEPPLSGREKKALEREAAALLRETAWHLRDEAGPLASELRVIDGGDENFFIDSMDTALCPVDEEV